MPQVRKLDLFFGLCSFAGLVITVVLAMPFASQTASSADSKAVILALLFISVIMGGITLRSLLKIESLQSKLESAAPSLAISEKKISLLEKEIEASNRLFDEVANSIHNIQDQMRDRVHELMEIKAALDNGQALPNDEIIDVSRTNEMFYLFLLDNTKSMMDALTGDKCSVTIKLVTEGESGIIMVRTFMRDAGSYRSRKYIDTVHPEYPYYENTAFQELLSGGQKNYYCSDNLSAEKTYVNSNGGWSSSYNATLVVPIRMQMIPDEYTGTVDFSVIGFLCVDNARGGLLKAACIEFVASIADSLFIHMQLLSYIKGEANRLAELERASEQRGPSGSEADMPSETQAADDRAEGEDEQASAAPMPPSG